MMRQVSIHEDLEHTAQAAAELILERAQAALSARGALTIALSGGSTPRALYARIAAFPLPWSRVELCFGDERAVPPDHQDSNARMVQESLVLPAAIPEEHVHRMRGELPPEQAARDYEQTLRRLFAEDSAFPRFDIVLLGLGADGHTASLFPHSPVLAEQHAWVAPSVGPTPPSARLTLTYPVLNAARLVLFLVAGKDKSRALREVLEGNQSRDQIPARGIRPSTGELVFFVDRAAARELSGGSR
jgi:6-phosphogluconolactonase